MTDAAPATQPDGQVLDAARVADHLAIRDLAISYAHAVDDRDWARFEALFLPDAVIDYTSAGGIAGPPAEVAAWMPEGMSAIETFLHSISTHEIRFTGPDEARGRVHVFNRNGARWEGEAEIIDVSAVYEDRYVRVGHVWRFAERIERTRFVVGGGLAKVIRDLAGTTDPAGPPVIG